MTQQQATVRFGADISGFRNKLQQMTGLSRQQVSTMMAIFGTFSLARITSQIKDTIGQLDNMAKEARALGNSLEDHITLKYVAQRMGVNDRQLIRGFVRLQARVGDMAGTFQRLNMTVDSLDGMTAVQKLVAVARGAESTGNAIGELSRIFGEEVGPAIRRFAMEYENLAPEARKNMEAMTKGAEAAEQYRAAITDLQFAFTRLVAQSGVIEFFTALTESANAIVNAVEKLNELGVGPAPLLAGVIAARYAKIPGTAAAVNTSAAISSGVSALAATRASQKAIAMAKALEAPVRTAQKKETNALVSMLLNPDKASSADVSRLAMARAESARATANWAAAGGDVAAMKARMRASAARHAATSTALMRPLPSQAEFIKQQAAHKAAASSTAATTTATAATVVATKKTALFSGALKTLGGVLGKFAIVVAATAAAFGAGRLLRNLNDKMFRARIDGDMADLMIDSNKHASLFSSTAWAGFWGPIKGAFTRGRNKWDPNVTAESSTRLAKLQAEISAYEHSLGMVLSARQRQEFTTAFNLRNPGGLSAGERFASDAARYQDPFTTETSDLSLAQVTRRSRFGSRRGIATASELIRMFEGAKLAADTVDAILADTEVSNWGDLFENNPLFEDFRLGIQSPEDLATVSRRLNEVTGNVGNFRAAMAELVGEGNVKRLEDQVQGLLQVQWDDIVARRELNQRASNYYTDLIQDMEYQADLQDAINNGMVEQARLLRLNKAVSEQERAVGEPMSYEQFERFRDVFNRMNPLEEATAAPLSATTARVMDVGSLSTMHRIGGFRGTGAGQMADARRMQMDRRRNELLDQIRRNTERGADSPLLFQ